MIKRSIHVFLLLSVVVAMAPMAQAQITKSPVVAATSEAVAAPEQAVPSKDQLMGALSLPERAEQLRELGVPKEDVADAIRGTKESGLGATEAAETLESAQEAVKEHGPIDNFGAFVTGKVQEGLRGKDLAAAIKSEHQNRGKGAGHVNQADGKGKPDLGGKTNNADKAANGNDSKDAHGSDHGGKPENAGKPDNAGKSGAQPNHGGDNKPAQGKK